MDVSGRFFLPFPPRSFSVVTGPVVDWLLVRRVETLGFGIPLFGGRRADNVLRFRRVRAQQ